jgi:hypothetical protein
MINKAYRPLPNLKYNKDTLMKKYLENKTPWKQYGKNSYTALFTQLVNAEEIVSQFKPGIISDEVKFVKVLAGGHGGCHTDTRQVGILVPVQVESGQFTLIHEDSKKINDSEYLNLDGTEQPKAFANPKEIDRFYLDQPYFLNTHVPHSVIVNSSVDRIILTLGFVEKYDNWDLIMQMYDNGDLLI